MLFDSGVGLYPMKLCASLFQVCSEYVCPPSAVISTTLTDPSLDPMAVPPLISQQLPHNCLLGIALPQEYLSII